jgi:hypothetical protein
VKRAAVVVPSVAVDGDELEVAERELEESRQARRESLTRSRELQRAGSDLAAGHAAKAARDHAQAARAIAAEVVLLRESRPRVDAAVGEVVIGVVERWVRAVGLPWGSGGAARRLFGELFRRVGAEGVEGGDDAGLARLGELARGELFQFYAARLADAVPAAPVGEDPDDELDEDEPATNPAPTGARPKRAVEDEQVLELVSMDQVPAAWLSRYAMDDAGRERGRVAYSEHLRERERRRQDAEQAAEASAPRRISTGGTSPLPAGWDRGPRGRGRGPSERAGE